MGTYWVLSIFSILLFLSDKLFSILFCKAKQWHCIGNDYGLFQWMHKGNFISVSSAIECNGTISMYKVSLERKCGRDWIVGKIEYILHLLQKGSQVTEIWKLHTDLLFWKISYGLSWKVGVKSTYNTALQSKRTGNVSKEPVVKVMCSLTVMKIFHLRLSKHLVLKWALHILLERYC